MDADTRTLMEACCLCPRECGVNRFVETGYCGGGAAARVNLHRLHFWEEPVISGTGGSGTIFFSHCTMACAYCQNHRISQEGRGTERSVPELAAMMLELQEAGAHNVNLVTASQFTPQAAEAIRLARARGLRVPVLWNSNAYEKPETLRMLEGLVDVYLPDFRYIDSNAAEQYSDAPGYPDIAKAAILEMHRQVGHLALSNDIAQKGLIIRILVLPGLHESVRPILRWIQDALGTETWISLMGQYYPVHRSAEFPEINRAVTEEEYEACLAYLDELGFENGFVQEVGSCSDYTPEFT
ncbi:MAG: radical SAM protein [Spirochaetes bacterium]|nr:radical SAM protein [Spirochaetota bacterium]